jgi:hypothetical protein
MAVSTAAYAGAWAYALFLSPHGGDDQTAALLIVGGFLVYLGILIVSVGAIIVNWQDKRSGRQPPRRPAAGARGQTSQRLPSVGPDRQLSPAGHDPRAEAEQSRRPRLPFSRWRPPVSLPTAR